MDAGLVKGEAFAVDASIIKADASRQRGVPANEQAIWSDLSLSTRAVREYLEALNEEVLAETLPKRLSLTAPQARWTAVPGDSAFFAYLTNYLIDAEHGVIVDVEPTPAHRTAEVAIDVKDFDIGGIHQGRRIRPPRIKPHLRHRNELCGSDSVQATPWARKSLNGTACCIVEAILKAQSFDKLMKP